MNLKAVRLSYEYKEQFLDMISEWKKYNDEHPEANHSPWAIFKNDYSDFDYYLNHLENTDFVDGFVPDITIFGLDLDRNIFVGAANIRLALNDNNILNGGHIGDGIRPSERGKGYATELIRLALIECKNRGINKVMMTCDPQNEGSKKSIIKNGGVFESEVADPESGEIDQRYWIDLGEEVIETDRLIMRRIMASDYKEAAIWCMDKKCYTYLLSNPCEKPEDCMTFLRMNDPNSDSRIIMIIHRKEDGQALGVISCCLDQTNNEWEIAYNLRSDEWGKGYTTEAARGLIDYISKKHGGHIFIGECADENVASRRIFEKLGMKYEKASSYTKKDGSVTFKSSIYKMEI